MAAIDFPNSPSLNDTFTVGDKTWLWDGSHWRVLALPSGINTIIKDTDNDTKVQVEESADEDIIRFDIAGVEKMTLDALGLDVIDDLDVHGNITVDGQTNIGGHVIPDTNDTYDLGSAEYKFRDLYLGSTTIYIGDATISSDGTAVNVAQLNVNGAAISSDGTAVNVAQLNVNGAAISSDGSTITIPALSISSPPAPTTSAPRNITISLSEPTGGSDGDIWMVYS